MGSIVHIFSSKPKPPTALESVIDEMESVAVDTAAAAEKAYAGYVDALSLNKRVDKAAFASAMAVLGKAKDDLTADTATMRDWHNQVKFAEEAEPKLPALGAEATAAEAAAAEAQERAQTTRRAAVEARHKLRGQEQVRDGRDNLFRANRSLLKHTAAGAKLEALCR